MSNAASNGKSRGMTLADFKAQREAQARKAQKPQKPQKPPKDDRPLWRVDFNLGVAGTGTAYIRAANATQARLLAMAKFRQHGLNGPSKVTREAEADKDKG